VLLAGKRRYDRKQAGFGGQTKPVFHKKVCSSSSSSSNKGSSSKQKEHNECVACSSNRQRQQEQYQGHQQHGSHAWLTVLLLSPRQQQGRAAMRGNHCFLPVPSDMLLDLDCS
jgi:ribosomal protein L44E